MSIDEEDDDDTIEYQRPINAKELVRKGDCILITTENAANRGWYCTKNHDPEPMDLSPVNRSVNPDYWKCRKCDNQISMTERDGVFLAVLSNIRDKYIKDIEVFSYDRKTNTFNIKGQWIGRSRHTAKRIKMTSGRRQDLIGELLSTVRDTLSIHVTNLKEYWTE